MPTEFHPLDPENLTEKELLVFIFQDMKSLEKQFDSFRLMYDDNCDNVNHRVEKLEDCTVVQGKKIGQHDTQFKILELIGTAVVAGFVGFIFWIVQNMVR